MAHGSNEVVPKQAGSQQASRTRAGEIEESEHNASASASAGLNLNVFGALSGAFSGKKKTDKDSNADGSSTEHTEEEGVGHVRGAGAGNLSAVGSASAQENSRHRKAVGAEQDHLGIEAAK